MKLNPNFITHMMGDTQVMVSAGTDSFSGMVRSNRTAAFIIDCLKENTTAAEIADAFARNFQVSRETADRDVAAVTEKLRQIGAIDD